MQDIASPIFPQSLYDQNPGYVRPLKEAAEPTRRQSGPSPCDYMMCSCMRDCICRRNIQYAVCRCAGVRQFNSYGLPARLVAEVGLAHSLRLGFLQGGSLTGLFLGELRLRLRLHLHLRTCITGHPSVTGPWSLTRRPVPQIRINRVIFRSTSN